MNSLWQQLTNRDCLFLSTLNGNLSCISQQKNTSLKIIKPCFTIITIDNLQSDKVITIHDWQFK